VTNIPDYLVVNDGVWARGFGAVPLAGFWGQNWEYMAEDSYSHIKI
jgi:hypothetical protein